MNEIDDILASVDRDAIPQETRDLQALTRAWVSERCAPEVLPWPTELMDRVMGRVRRQIEKIEDLTASTTATPSSTFPLIILQTDLSRVQFLVRSYLRTRLSKLSNHALFYLTTTTTTTTTTAQQQQQQQGRGGGYNNNNDYDESESGGSVTPMQATATATTSEGQEERSQDSYMTTTPISTSTTTNTTTQTPAPIPFPNNPPLLSPPERTFLTTHQSLLYTLYRDSFLSSLPEALRRLDDKVGGVGMGMIEGPDVDKAVFVRVLRDEGGGYGGVGGEGEGEGVLEGTRRGDVIVRRWREVRGVWGMGGVELV
ncbi:MAG: GINS complex subunit [Cirrosporium novae-zelandiae]|nr:MAG: GINS complex subunit [Cirrosporium novae-zelandiae]